MRELLVDFPEPDARGEAKIQCPFHDDRTPSCSVNVRNKLFKCFGCGKEGSVIDLWAQVTGQPRHAVVTLLARTIGVTPDYAVNPRIVEEYYGALRLSAELLELLEKSKGLSGESVDKFRLGWDAKARRLTIPIKDEAGLFVNIRSYDLLKIHPPAKKYTSLARHGQIRLVPHEALQGSEEIVVAEGELKMIGLRQRGFNAVTATGGSRNWRDEWSPLFRGKRVVIAYDVDQAGADGAKRLANRLVDLAAEVRVVQLPLDLQRHPHGDVLDYFVQGGYGPQDFRNLIVGTPQFQKDKPFELPDDANVYDVDLSSASKAQYYQKRVKVPVIVSAKNTSPYIAPRTVKVNCPKNMEMCAVCPVFLNQAGDAAWEFEADEAELLEFINVTTSAQDRAIREKIGIPTGCDVSDLLIADQHNIEEVRLVPQFSTTNLTPASSENAVVRAFHVGHGIETNATYEITARSVVDPATQVATLLAYEAKPNVDNLSSFKPSTEELNELLLFQPTNDDWSSAGVQGKLDEIYSDLEANVTRIYQRRQLHALMDLVWHSALFVTFNGEPIKGWVDALVIGDSGQGKTETASRLLKHYGVGERVDMKGASTAGLKGGVQETQGRWFVTWGAIPLNDRRLVILEEVKGCPPEVLQSLTDMRSSGRAELTKIERRSTFARTRLLWISNPRSDRRIETYSFGAEAIKELLGSLEDVRRFDAALVVASNEVDAAVITQQVQREPVPHRFTSELCRRLILWVWSRRPEDVVLEPAATQACLDLAVEQGQRYSSAIPLVEPADHRLKLARLAAAIAARTFSCDEYGERLVVREGHVRWAAEFLNTIYSSRFMGYADYSDVKRSDAAVTDVASIKAALMALPYPMETIKGLMRSGEIRPSDIGDWGGVGKDQARDLLSLLVRSNALRRQQNSYYKTGAFIELLKRFQSLEFAGNQARTGGPDEF